MLCGIFPARLRLSTPSDFILGSSIMKRRITGFLLAANLALPHGVTAGDHHPELTAADEAYSAGQYETAAALYRRDAEVGIVAAQVNLALLLMDGQGLAQDYALAAQWFGRAAEQGNTEAQQNLALLYRDGKGVTRSNVEAAKWFLIAGAEAEAAALEKGMTPEQKAEVTKRAEDWIAKFGRSGRR
jgi:TPR repeat protein